MARWRRILLMVLATAALGGSVACEHVKPWEKNVLARPDMAWAPGGNEDEMRSSVFFSKEAALTGGGAGGGGCGCN